MGGSEGELLDAVRQPVVTLSVKDLPARGKLRVPRQRCTWNPPPDEALCWCDVRCAPGVKVRHYNGAA